MGKMQWGTKWKTELSLFQGDYLQFNGRSGTCTTGASCLESMQGNGMTLLKCTDLKIVCDFLLQKCNVNGRSEEDNRLEQCFPK